MPQKKPCHGPATHGPSNLPGRCQDRRSYFATPATSCGRMRSKRCESELRDGSVWWRKTQGKTVKNHEKTMKNHEKTMKNHEKNHAKTMKNHEKPRKTQENHEKPMKNHEQLLKYHEKPRDFCCEIHQLMAFTSHEWDGLKNQGNGGFRDHPTIHSRANLGQESKRMWRSHDHLRICVMWLDFG